VVDVGIVIMVVVLVLVDGVVSSVLVVDVVGNAVGVVYLVCPDRL